MIGYPVAAVLVLAVALLLIAGAPRHGAGALKMFSSGIAFISAGIFLAVVTSALDIMPNRSGGDDPDHDRRRTGRLSRPAGRCPTVGCTAWEPSTFFRRVLPYVPSASSSCAPCTSASAPARTTRSSPGPAICWLATVLGRQFLTLWLNAS